MPPLVQPDKKKGLAHIASKVLNVYKGLGLENQSALKGARLFINKLAHDDYLSINGKGIVVKLEHYNQQIETLLEFEVIELEGEFEEDGSTYLSYVFI